MDIWTVVGDLTSQTPYAYRGDQWISYDDQHSTLQKVQNAKIWNKLIIVRFYYEKKFQRISDITISTFRGSHFKIFTYFSDEFCEVATTSWWRRLDRGRWQFCWAFFHYSSCYAFSSARLIFNSKSLPFYLFYKKMW